MPRTAKPPKPTEEQQPPLFSVELFPDVPKMVECTKRFVHTGKVTCKDEERAAAIATAFLETGMVLPVARRFHVSPNTVQAVVRVLEETGKLDDLKQRLSSKLGLLAEVSAEAAIQMVVDGKCPANVLPINVGVSVEKKALLDGDATARVEAVQAGPVEVNQVLEYLKARGIAAPAIDVPSIVSTEKPKETEG